MKLIIDNMPVSFEKFAATVVNGCDDGKREAAAVEFAAKTKGEINSRLAPAEQVKEGRITGKQSGKLTSKGMDKRKTTLRMGGNTWELSFHDPLVELYLAFIRLDEFAAEFDGMTVIPSWKNLPPRGAAWLQKLAENICQKYTTVTEPEPVKAPAKPAETPVNA